jgi:hypothetical protein
MKIEPFSTLPLTLPSPPPGERIRNPLSISPSPLWGEGRGEGVGFCR